MSHWIIRFLAIRFSIKLFAHNYQSALFRQCIYVQGSIHTLFSTGRKHFHKSHGKMVTWSLPHIFILSSRVPVWDSRSCHSKCLFDRSIESINIPQFDLNHLIMYLLAGYRDGLSVVHLNHFKSQLCSSVTSSWQILIAIRAILATEASSISFLTAQSPEERKHDFFHM